LLAAGDEALGWAVRHDLLGEDLEPDPLWQLPAPVRLLRAQRSDGSWRYGGGGSRLRSETDYDQLATYQSLLSLTAQYRLDSRHPALARAAGFALGFQSPAGDLRGIYGSQYSPNYTAAILAVLVEAGYRADPRVDRAYAWLLSIRQDDGGWAIPLRTVRRAVARSFAAAMRLPEPLEPDRTRPFSHLVTGIVLRALVAHPGYRSRAETSHAARLLSSRLFARDAYPDRRDPSYWTKLAYPFRWTDVVSALDAIGLGGLQASEPKIAEALSWLVDAQGENGLWRAGYESPRNKLTHAWASFAATRVLKRFDVWAP
jgi:hypothetical protein